MGAVLALVVAGQVPPAASAVPVPLGPVGGGFTLRFADEFEGTRLDEAKWSNGHGWGQVSRYNAGFCDPANNVVAAGVLRQTIDRRGQGGRPFSIGCVNSKDRFSQLHGFFEVRIKAAACSGARSSFWGKPNDESWPPELDIVEAYGGDPRRADLTLHWRQPDRRHLRSKGHATGADFTAGFHVFGAHWKPAETVWYLDGREVRRTKAGARFMDDGGPFYLMMEAQVIRASSPCGRDPARSSALVDYVRVWSR